MFSSVQLDFWLDLQARVGGPGTNCLFREAQCLSLALVLWTVSKVETKPDKRLGTGTQNEELKLREDRAPTQAGQELPPHCFPEPSQGSHTFSPTALPFPPLPTSGQQLGLALTLSPWASITKDGLPPQTG